MLVLVPSGRQVTREIVSGPEDDAVRLWTTPETVKLRVDPVMPMESGEKGSVFQMTSTLVNRKSVPASMATAAWTDWARRVTARTAEIITSMALRRGLIPITRH